MTLVHENPTDTTESTKAAAPQIDEEIIRSISAYQFGWCDPDTTSASAKHGLSEVAVHGISAKKNEPEWIPKCRLKVLEIFDRKPLSIQGTDLSGTDLDNTKYFVRSTEEQVQTWGGLPEDIKDTYDELGTPETEKQRLVAGVVVWYESEVVYHQIHEDLELQSVIFLDTSTALKEHLKLFREYFGTVISSGDNKLSTLNTTVWSGGSFIYVPKGVHMNISLRVYFRINTENVGQSERVPIIVNEDTYVHYVEGCTAPIYKSDSLHPVVVEIIAKKGGHCRYIMVQNQSNSIYNLVTKRIKCEEDATMERINGDIGPKVTMKHPAVQMTGPHVKGEVLPVATAGEGQLQDTGVKMVHMAPRMGFSIMPEFVARSGGHAAYRGLTQVNKGAKYLHFNIECDALLIDTISRSDTCPYVDVREDGVTLGHEATVSKVSGDRLFYLVNHGIEGGDAMAMVVRGFVKPIVKEFPMEYALKLSHLIELQTEGSVG